VKCEHGGLLDLNQLLFLWMHRLCKTVLCDIIGIDHFVQFTITLDINDRFEMHILVLQEIPCTNSRVI